MRSKSFKKKKKKQTIVLLNQLLHCTGIIYFISMLYFLMKYKCPQWFSHFFNWNLFHFNEIKFRTKKNGIF